MRTLAAAPSLYAHCWRMSIVIALTVGLTALLVSRLIPPGSYRPGALQQNLAEHFAGRHQLLVAPNEIFLPAAADRLTGLAPREVYFLARTAPVAPKDVYFAHFVASDKAIPVHVSPAFNLSKTSAADEQSLVFDGRRHLAYASSIKGKTPVVTILDLRGLSGESLGGFSSLQKLQQQLTNWQESGRLDGLDRIEVKLTLPWPVSLHWQGEQLVLRGTLGNWQVVVDPLQAKVLQGPAAARRIRLGKRSFVAWAVDTVRNFSFVGPKKIAWLEDVVYGVVDKARRMSGAKVTAFDIKDEMELPVVTAQATTKLTGWPPPPLKPILPAPLKGEGQWVEVQGPFLRQQAGMPSLFAMTFVRPDRERLFAKVYFVAWDPRRVELRMVGGTAEPRSATGELGRGMIPRDPELLSRLVGAFNGGFQTMHGDFGMMEQGKVYCPPKPWAATVAQLGDGSTGFGTWDGSGQPHVIPSWITSFRQNLTPLVEDHEYNPWRRGSWGGGAGFLTGSGPTAHIIRSGLCLHTSGHVMYVMGDPVDGPILGQTMQKVGCTYGMELDINRGHVGFEFYNVLRASEGSPPDADTFKPVKYFARHGSVPGAPDLSYYMREVVHGTGNSPVPRWLGREARDFFYLFLRPTGPGADLPALAGKPNEGRWTAAAIPAEATQFPQALARTFVHLQPQLPDRRVHLVELDLRWLETTLCVPTAELGCMPEAGGRLPLAILPLGAFNEARQLFADGKALASAAGGQAPFFSLRPARPQGPALARLGPAADTEAGAISVQGAPPAADAPSHDLLPRAALCSTSRGTALYASGLNASRDDLKRALAHAGCSEVIFLGAAEPLLFQHEQSFTSLYGGLFPPVATSPSLIVHRSQASWGLRIFTNVKPLPRSIWTMAQPESTRASTLRQAKLAAKKLGLEPPTALEQLCQAPYTEHKELRKWRWRDPQTGMVCGHKDEHWVRWHKKQRERMHQILQTDQEPKGDQGGAKSAPGQRDGADGNGSPPAAGGLPASAKAAKTAKRGRRSKLRRNRSATTPSQKATPRPRRPRSKQP